MKYFLFIALFLISCDQFHSGEDDSGWELLTIKHRWHTDFTTIEYENRIDTLPDSHVKEGLYLGDDRIATRKLFFPDTLLVKKSRYTIANDTISLESDLSIRDEIMPLILPYTRAENLFFITYVNSDTTVTRYYTLYPGSWYSEYFQNQ